MAKIQDIDIPHLEFAEAAAPATPASGVVRIYAKTDGQLYQKDDAGAETALANAAGGSVATDAIFDAAGDLVVGTGADTAARLAIGTNGHVLTSNGTTATWAAATGGGGDFVYINEVVVSGSAAAQMNITAIPNTYRDLYVVILARTSNTAVQGVTIQVGPVGGIDTGSNYRHQRDSTGSGNVNVSSTSVTSVSAGMAVETGATAGNFASTTVEIFSYADTTIWRAMHTKSIYYTTVRYLNNGQGAWMNTADEIERIRATLSAGDFEIGSRMTLYGRG